MPLPHIGRLIKAELDRQPKAHTVQWFADRMCFSRPNAYSLFRRETLDVAIVHRACLVLNHDFFADISRAMADDGEEPLCGEEG